MDTSGVPELRWSTTRKHREIDKQGRAVEVREHIARLGKKRAAIIEHLLDRGGAATLGDLVEVFGTERTRPRDFKRRQLSPLTDPAVITIVGDTVTLTEDWRGALEEARALAGEQEQARLQRQRHERQRLAYRQRNKVKPDPVPEMPAVDDLRQPWPRHPTGCACRACSERFGRVLGEHVKRCKCAECPRTRRTAEPRKTRRFRILRLAPDPIPVIHSLVCECAECAYPEPKYARAYVGSGAA